MAPILLPIALAAASGLAGVALGVTTITAAAISVGITAVAAGASYLLRPNVGAASSSGAGVSSIAEPVAAEANAQRNVPISQPIPPRRFVYGKCRTGGAIFFEDNANPYLFVGTAISDGEIQAIDAVYFGEESIPLDGTGAAASGSRFNTFFNAEFATGLSSQAASALLLSGGFAGIDASFKQAGVARGVARLHWGADAQTNNVLWGDGIAPSYLVRGVKVYDPRDGTQTLGTPSTYKYSDNPALCIAHALTNAWGVALPTSAIDWTSVASAANDCDMAVTGYGPMFRVAGIFQADSDMASQIGDLLSSCRGRVTFSGGKYALSVDKAQSSVWTVIDADILELGEFSSGTQAAGLFNAISAVYYDGNVGGTRTTTTPYQLTAAISSEGLRETNVTLPFTPDNYSAQIIAFRELMTSRDGRALSVRLTDAALYLSPGEVITIATTEAPFINGDWQVQQVDAADVGALLSLKGYNAAAYADPLSYIV